MKFLECRQRRQPRDGYATPWACARARTKLCPFASTSHYVDYYCCAQRTRPTPMTCGTAARQRHKNGSSRRGVRVRACVYAGRARVCKYNNNFAPAENAISRQTRVTNTNAIVRTFRRCSALVPYALAHLRTRRGSCNISCGSRARYRKTAPHARAATGVPEKRCRTCDDDDDDCDEVGDGGGGRVGAMAQRMSGRTGGLVSCACKGWRKFAHNIPIKRWPCSLATRGKGRQKRGGDGSGHPMGPRIEVCVRKLVRDGSDELLRSRAARSCLFWSVCVCV